MGLWFSSNGGRRNNFLPNPPPLPPPPPPPPPPRYSSPSYYHQSEHHHSPPPPAPAQTHQFADSSNPTPTYPPYAVPPTPLPPPPLPVQPYYYPGGYSMCNYGTSSSSRVNYYPYYANQPNWWRPPAVPQPFPSQPPLLPVEQRPAKKIKNDVNVHKDTLRLVVDEQNPDHHLVSFVFDALYDGSITIFYFAKEEKNCTFVPIFPEALKPVKVPFQKGSAQKFRQPSGTGADLGFFELDDLSKPSPGEDVFPVVISAETYSPEALSERNSGESLPSTLPHMQITQAVLEKNNENDFHVKVIRQLLWIDGVRYELREIYGMGSLPAEGFDDNDPGKECVICMTEAKDTAVLPCRHMCMCSECAKALKSQSNKCPICRQPIQELIEIKINNSDE